MNRFLGLLPAISGLFLFLVLTSCSTLTDTQVLRTPLNLSPEHFICEENGVRPRGENIMESEVGRYISSLEFANLDCRTKLSVIRVIIECHNDPQCNVEHLVRYIGLVPQPERVVQPNIIE